MAKKMGVRADYALERAEALAGQVPPALEASIDELEPHLDGAGRDMALNLRKFVNTATKRSITRILNKRRP